MAPSDRRKRRAYDAIAARDCKGVGFDEVCAVLELHGWELDRISGSHHIYRHEDYEGIISLPRPHGGAELKRIYCRQAMEAIAEVGRLWTR